MAERKRLKRWTDQPLLAEKFADIGVSGSDTMEFEQGQLSLTFIDEAMKAYKAEREKISKNDNHT